MIMAFAVDFRGGVFKIQRGFDLKKKVFGAPICSRRLCANGRKSGFLGSRIEINAVIEMGVENVEKSSDSKGLAGLLEFDVVSEMELKESGLLGLRKTKLVCTVGPACSSSEDLEKLALAGMNVARLNICHNTREWHRDVISRIKKLNKDKGYCVSLMIDTEGSQIHVVDGASSSVKAEEGSIWFFTTERFEGSRPFTIQTNYEGFSEGVKVGDEIVFDGGMATFEVVEAIGNDLRCKCTSPGILFPRAKLSFWREGSLLPKNNELPTLSTKDWFDIEFGISEGVDFIALSFVKDGDAVKHLKQYLSKKSKFIQVLAKIETLESLNNLKEIVEASDGIMIARGDLAVEISLDEIPMVQEEIIRLCREMNKPVVVASQLLESMVEYPIPTRAEVADVSEAVRQYCDALMLSGESAIGPYGEKALSVLNTTSRRIERWCREGNRQNGLVHHRIGASSPEQITEQICSCASVLANNLDLDAIFVYTKQGQMASLISRNRPNPPIFAFTDRSSTRMALNLLWGVTPMLVHLSENMEENINSSIDDLKARGLIKNGDTILIVSDTIPAQTLFHMIQVKIVE